MHVSFFGCWSFILITLIASQFLGLWPAQALDITQTGDVTLTAIVPSVNATPAEPIIGTSGGSSGVGPSDNALIIPPPRPELTSDTVLFDENLVIKPDPAHSRLEPVQALSPNLPEDCSSTISTQSQKLTTLNRCSSNLSHWVFTSPYLEFSGESAHPNSTLFINMEVGGREYRSSTTTTDSGSWHWRSPEAVQSGRGRLTAFYLYQGANVANSIDFDIDLPANVVSSPVATNNSNFLPTPQLNLFDTFIQVLPVSLGSEAGRPVITRIDMRNFTRSASDLVNVVVVYKIIGPNQQVVLESSETLRVSQQSSFRKTFYTDPGLRPGTYTVLISAAAGRFIASASDTFNISGIASAVAASAQPSSGARNHTFYRAIMMFLPVAFTGLAIYELVQIRRLSLLLRLRRYLGV